MSGHCPQAGNGLRHGRVHQQPAEPADEVHVHFGESQRRRRRRRPAGGEEPGRLRVHQGLLLKLRRWGQDSGPGLLPPLLRAPRQQPGYSIPREGHRIGHVCFRVHWRLCGDEVRLRGKCHRREMGHPFYALQECP